MIMFLYSIIAICSSADLFKVLSLQPVHVTENVEEKLPVEGELWSGVL